MILREILQQLSKIHHLPSLELEAYGTCTLTINETLPISFERAFDDQGFFIFTVVGQLSQTVDEKEILSYLNANLFGSQTGRANLGYDNHTHSLVLFEYFEENNLEFSSFLDRFAKFTGYATYWLAKMDSPIPQLEV